MATAPVDVPARVSLAARDMLSLGSSWIGRVDE